MLKHTSLIIGVLPIKPITPAAAGSFIFFVSSLPFLRVRIFRITQAQKIVVKTFPKKNTELEADIFPKNKVLNLIGWRVTIFYWSTSSVELVTEGRTKRKES